MSKSDEVWMTIGMHIFFSILYFALSCITLTSCATTQTTENTPQATIHLEKIIDKETLQPLEKNTITLRWETPDGEVLNTEQYEDQESFSTVMPADGSVRLFIEVELPSDKRG